MDTSTYNCRDYQISPHSLTNTNTNTNNPIPKHAHLPRHESYAELEHRSRSPASLKPKFPLLSLPLELRQQILLYLLPHTQEPRGGGGAGTNQHHADILETHVRNFSAVQRRVRKGMELPPEKHKPPTVPTTTTTTPPPSNQTTQIPPTITWHRGLTALLSVNRQLHAESADLLYGRNTFLVAVSYSSITFRFRYILPSGMAPQREYDFFHLVPEKYLRRVRKLLVLVEHVDAYTGMVKWNVGGRGLVVGLKGQVGRLVGALQGGGSVRSERGGGDGDEGGFEEEEEERRRRGFTRVMIRVSNGHNTTTGPRGLKARFAGVERVSQEIEEILTPFGCLSGVADARVGGAVGQSFARELEGRMRGWECCGEVEGEKGGECFCRGGGGGVVKGKDSPPLCVYGNDI